MQNGLRLCQKLELDTAKRVKHLSPGQQKKLQMVIAMTGDPDFYILDEPTAGLDPNASHEMNKLIQELHQQGKSILIVNPNWMVDAVRKSNTGKCLHCKKCRLYDDPEKCPGKILFNRQSQAAKE